jgi:CRP-like cAMP-binding protein
VRAITQCCTSGTRARGSATAPPSADSRCACTLLRVAGLQFPRRSRPAGRSVPITQDELATLVNVSRTTLLQILRRFEEQGLVEQAYRALRVVDSAGLKEIAEGRQR